MSLIIDGSNGLTFPNSTTQASGGKVIQVVQGSYSTVVSNATTTFADTGLTASITPKFSTSKILVIVNQCGIEKGGGNSQNCVEIAMFRNSTQLASTGYYGGYTNSVLAVTFFSGNLTYLDSPATTSSTTYKTQFKNGLVASAVYVQSGGSPYSTITLMEIAG